MNIITKMQMGEKKNFVEQHEAIKWIEDTIVGPVTKEILEQERFKELDGLDMMQNTGIIYNPQAIIETQILTTLSIFTLQAAVTGIKLQYSGEKTGDLQDKEL